jgi:hypothetical protein
MKKNQNTLPKPSFALPTFNRSLKLMALALVSLVAGVGNTNAQTPAIVGRAIILTQIFGSGKAYLTQEQYQAVMSRKNTNWERDPFLGLEVAYQNNELKARYYIGAGYRYYTVQNMTLTNNGLMIRHGVYSPQGEAKYYTPTKTVTVKYSTPHSPSYEQRVVDDGFLFIDFNELAVNRAMSAAPIGTLKVTPSNNASEQTKVQWSVE